MTQLREDYQDLQRNTQDKVIAVCLPSYNHKNEASLFQVKQIRGNVTQVLGHTSLELSIEVQASDINMGIINSQIVFKTTRQDGATKGVSLDRGKQSTRAIQSQEFEKIRGKNLVKKNQAVVDEAEKKTSNYTASWAEAREEGRQISQWFPNISKNQGPGALYQTIYKIRLPTSLFENFFIIVSNQKVSEYKVCMKHFVVTITSSC